MKAIAPVPDQLSPIIGAALAASARALAGRIAGGATLWCVAPGLDDHGEHLAVEFVHPASVGGRAVPAVAVPSADCERLVQTVRRSVRAGDVVITLGDAHHPAVRDLARRAPVWGALRVHIGWGPDAASIGDHAVLLGADSDAERYLTRAYHLLWELTFLCLGGAGDPSARISAVPVSSCEVCSDAAAVGELTGEPADGLATVRTACGEQVVDVTLVHGVGVHDLVLVHAGAAIGLPYSEDL